MPGGTRSMKGEKQMIYKNITFKADPFSYNLEFDDRITLVGGNSGTGKTVLYEMLEDLRLTNEYKAIKLFNYKSDNFSESIEQCRDSFIVVDNADNLINDEVRRFINFEPSNQYMLFLRNCDGLNVSDKSFKVLKFDNNRITLEEELCIYGQKIPAQDFTSGNWLINFFLTMNLWLRVKGAIRVYWMH